MVIINGILEPGPAILNMPSGVGLRRVKKVYKFRMSYAGREKRKTMGGAKKANRVRNYRTLLALKRVLLVVTVLSSSLRHFQ